MNRGLRGARFAAGIVVAVGVGALAPGAAGADRFVTSETPFVLHGVVTVTWHGDRRSGCDAVGVCDLVGSARAAGSVSATIGRDEDGGGVTSFGSSGPDNPAVIRATWGLNGGASSRMCVDQVDGLSGLGWERASRGRFRIRLDGDFSSGRCAGPRPADIQRAMELMPVTVRAIARGRNSIDISRRTAFAAGPFAGEVTAIARLRLGRPRRSVLDFASNGASGGGGLDGGRRTRLAATFLAYRLEHVAGQFVTDFRGVPDSACTTLGVCGAQGNVTFALTGASGRLLVGGARRVSGNATRRGELRALRHGRYRLVGLADLAGTTRAGLSEKIVLGDGASCTDSLQVRPPGLRVHGKRHEVSIAIGGTAVQLFGAGPPEDPVRTHCPGPTVQDLLGNGTLARGTIPVSALGRSIPAVRLLHAGSFTEAGWTGTTRADLTGRLRLVAESVRFLKSRGGQ